jgi:leader peptidase (prepilin peptidase)/N-methyltransferase
MALAGFAAICAILASFFVAPGWKGAAGAFLASAAIAIAVIDQRQLIIPDELNAGAFLVGLLASGLESDMASDGFARAFARAAVMFAAFLVFRIGFRLLRGVEGVGMGDVKLAAVTGVWLDWIYLPIVVDIAALAALTAALVGRINGSDVGMRSKLPFGAFLAPAIWLCWLLATSIQDGAAAALSNDP